MHANARENDVPRDTERITRRDLLKRGLTLGVMAGAAGSLLAACNPFGDDEPESTPEAETDPAPDATPEPEPDGTPDATPDATPEPTPEPEPTPTPTEPQAGGTMTIALTQDPYSLHPDADANDNNWIVISQIHNALLEMDHNFELEPVLAENYEVAGDGLSYTFSLHQGVLFHNGAALTAADVTYTYEWFRDPANAAAKSLDYQRVASVEAPDEQTVVVNMEQPDATFIRMGATNYIVPSGYHAEVGSAGHSLDPIGTGPFALQQWQRGESIALEAFDDYFRGRPHLDAIQLSIITDPSARATALRDGEVDSVFDLPRDDSLQLEGEDGSTSFSAPSLDCNHFPLNNMHPVLSDRNVRQAMMFAIDRQQMIDDIYQGAATLATSHLSPALESWYESDVPEYDHSPERAVELLEGAGWVAGPDGIREREGTRLTFTCTTITDDEPRRRQAEMARDMFAEVGIEMILEDAPVDAILEGMRSGELDASVFNWTYGGWMGDPDARTTLHSGGFSNFSQFHNGQVDQLLLAGVETVDEEARRDVYSEIQRIVAEEVPFLFIMFWHSFYHFDARINGLPDSARWGLRLYRTTPQLWVGE